MKTIAAIIVTRDNFPKHAYESLIEQTKKPNLILFSNFAPPDKQVGTRIAKSLNMTLSLFDWRSFDYIFRMDDDTELPKDYLEVCLGQGGDLVGTGGSGLLFRKEVLERMGGKWPEVDNEDTYFLWKTRMLGFRDKRPAVKVSYRPFGKNYKLHQFVNYGRNGYTMGNNPLLFAKSIQGAARVSKRPGFLLALLGYSWAFLTQQEKLDVAKYVRQTQNGYIKTGLRAVFDREGWTWFRLRWLKRDFVITRGGAKFYIEGTAFRPRHMMTATLNHERRWAARICKSFGTGTFVDAGANVGGYSLRAAAKGMEVIAFEPDEIVLKALRRNVDLNPAIKDKITIFPCALGNVSGEVNLTDEGAGSKVTEGSGKKVKVMALDELDLSQLSVLKVDVEGYELEMLQGAVQTLERCRPLLFLEVHRFAGPEKAQKVYELLESVGYHLELFPVQETEDHIIGVTGP